MLSKGLCAEKQDEIDEELEPEVTANKRHRQDGNGKDDERALKPPKKTKAFSGGKVKKAQKTKKGDSKNKSQNEDKPDKSDFVIHIGAAPPSVTLATASSITSAPASSVTLATASSVTSAMASSVTLATASPVTSPQGYLTVDTEDLYHSDNTESDTTDTTERDESSHKKVHRVVVTDSPPDKGCEPKHYFSKQDYTTEQLDVIRNEIKKYNEEQKAWMEGQFNEIKKQLQFVMASGIAKTLEPILGNNSTTNQLQGPITHSNTITVSTPVRSTAVHLVTHSNVATVSTPVTSPAESMITHSNVDTVSTPVTSPAESMVSTCAPSNNTSATADLPVPCDVMNGEVEELIPHSNIVPFFTKAKNRPHFAALLVEHLIDEETRLKSNVRGRGKEKLDATIIEWVKDKSFKYYQSEGNSNNSGMI